jgi:hypothetical protein
MIISHHSQFTPAGPNSTEPAPDNARFLCATCWRLFPARIPGQFSSPYGIDRAGGLHCLDCCHLRDVQKLKDRGKAFFAYLSQDGRTITNWPGGELGRAHSVGHSRAGWHGATIYRFHVRDVHGEWWQGRGAGPGMCCTLRAMKRPGYAKHWGA